MNGNTNEHFGMESKDDQLLEDKALQEFWDWYEKVDMEGIYRPLEELHKAIRDIPQALKEVLNTSSELAKCNRFYGFLEGICYGREIIENRLIVNKENDK